MAQKEYTKGDVIGIIGRVIGKGFEIIGFGIFLGAKVMSKLSTSISWMVGKQVDMTNTIKERRAKERISIYDYDLVKDSTPELLLPELELENNAPKAQKAANEFNLIRQALDYGEKAHKSNLLPINEILRIDRQALIMAKATRNILKNNSNSVLNVLELKTAEALVNACSFYEQYHATGNTSFRKKAQENLVQAGYQL